MKSPDERVAAVSSLMYSIQFNSTLHLASLVRKTLSRILREKTE